MGGCGGCTTGNSFNPGGHYVGVRINENEDGRVVFCETLGAPVEKGQRLVVEGEQDPAVAPAYRYADMAYRLLSALVAGKSDAEARATARAAA